MATEKLYFLRRSAGKPWLPITEKQYVTAVLSTAEPLTQWCDDGAAVAVVEPDAGCRTIIVLNERVKAWRKRGWIVVFEANEYRDAYERFSCEVYEREGGESLPRGIGYVCGYGATPEDAEADAQFRLDFGEPDGD